MSVPGTKRRCETFRKLDIAAIRGWSVCPQIGHPQTQGFKLIDGVIQAGGTTSPCPAFTGSPSTNVGAINRLPAISRCATRFDRSIDAVFSTLRIAAVKRSSLKSNSLLSLNPNPPEARQQQRRAGDIDAGDQAEEMQFQPFHRADGDAGEAVQRHAPAAAGAAADPVAVGGKIAPDRRRLHAAGQVRHGGHHGGEKEFDSEEAALREARTKVPWPDEVVKGG